MYFNYLHCKTYQGVGQFSDDLIKKTSVKKRENHMFGRNFKMRVLVRKRWSRPVDIITALHDMSIQAVLASARGRHPR